MLDMLTKNGFTVTNNFSYHFSAIPLLSRYKTFKYNRIIKWLSNRYSSNLYSGFTILAKKSVINKHSYA